jgi:transcriptional regulator with XRE-family HTH domain
MAELARQIGASRSAVTKWFAGESKPDSRHIPALSRHLGVPQLDLWRYYMEQPLDVMPALTEQRFSDVLAVPDGISDEALGEAVADIQAHWPVFCARREQERANRRARAAVQEAILGAVVEDQSHMRQQAIEAAESPPADTPESPPPRPPADRP